MKTIFLIMIALSQIVSAFDDYYYQNENGVILGVEDKIIVKIRDGVAIDNLLSQFNLSFEKMLAKNLYLLKVEHKKFAIDVSNKLSEHDAIQYAQPDFIRTKTRR